MANNPQASINSIFRQNSQGPSLFRNWLEQNSPLKTKGATEVGKYNQMLNKESLHEVTGKGFKINIKA